MTKHAFSALPETPPGHKLLARVAGTLFTMNTIYLHTQPNPPLVPVPCTSFINTGYPQIDMDKFERCLMKGNARLYTNQECHILRLSRLIRQKKLRCEDVLLFVAFDNEWREIPIDSEGEFYGPFPNEFLSWRMKELFE